MRTLDLTPLFRSTVGFDRLSRALDTAMRIEDTALSYPPYNIEKVADDEYRITVAVAGFSEDDLEITTHDGNLAIRGRIAGESSESSFLYRGIAGRPFERKFQLADYIKVVGANLANGILTVELRREVPEAMKPRTIEIKSGGKQAKRLEAAA